MNEPYAFLLKSWSWQSNLNSGGHMHKKMQLMTRNKRITLKHQLVGQSWALNKTSISELVPKKSSHVRTTLVQVQNLEITAVKMYFLFWDIQIMFYNNFLFTVINMHLNVLENSIGERQLGYSSL